MTTNNNLDKIMKRYYVSDIESTKYEQTTAVEQFKSKKLLMILKLKYPKM